MNFRWPWQTRESAVISLLDQVLADAERTRLAANEVTETVKAQIEHREDGQ